LAGNGIDISLSPAAADYLTKHGYQPEFGARPLKRLMQHEIINELAKKILAGEVKKEDKILVDFKQGKLEFTAQK
jgi:ATP-dependent Clp protease ATP-binding subunit ClpB